MSLLYLHATCVKHENQQWSHFKHLSACGLVIYMNMHGQRMRVYLLMVPCVSMPRWCRYHWTHPYSRLSLSERCRPRQQLNTSGNASCPGPCKAETPGGAQGEPHKQFGSVPLTVTSHL